MANYKIGVLIILFFCVSAGCSVSQAIFRAYSGPELPRDQVAVIRGTVFSRQDGINRYADAIRFMSVDGTPVTNSESYSQIELMPGTHDVTVYFSWDTGSQRGLAPALVNYASTRDSVSRTLRITVAAGQEYEARGEPVYKGRVQEITELAYVDFWIVDSRNTPVVPRNQGRYSSQL